MSTTTNRGYSDFFASGIRVVSRRFATPRFEDVKAPSAFPLSFNTISEPEHSQSKAMHRARPTSTIITLPKSALSAHSKAQQRQRRSSLISISSRFFGRKSRSMSNDESGWVSSSANSTSSFPDPLDSWDISGASDSPWPLPSCPNGGTEEPQFLDPFSPSPSSKSFFVDLQESPKSRRSSSGSSSSSSSSFFSNKRDSFLRITPTPPPDASFLHFPRIRPSQGVRDRDSHIRERPASVHIMPTSLSTELIGKATNTTTTTTTTTPPSVTGSTRPPSYARTRSRVSSFLSKSSSISVGIPEDTDADNVMSPTEPIVKLIEEEEEDPVSATDAHMFFSREDDAPARMDWRQFHTELLASQDA